MFIYCDEQLAAAIESTSMSKVRKLLYKRILDIQNGRVVVSKIAVELIPDVIKREEIREVKRNYENFMKGRK